MIEILHSVTARVFEKPAAPDWPADLSALSLHELDRRFGRALQREVAASHGWLRSRREQADEWAGRRERIEQEVRRRLGPGGRSRPGPLPPVL